VAVAPTVADSLDRVVEAAQHVVGDEIGLLRVEVSSAVGSAARSAVMMLAGAILLTISWVAFLIAGYAALVPTVRALYALLLLAAVNLVPGIGLLLAARTPRKGGVETHGER
jgi:hypothetical protein